MENNSLTRLNDYKIETNKMIAEIDEATYYINSIKSRYINLENIGRAYENKVYKIYTELEKKGIDFWSDEFEFREAILGYLQTKLFYGAIILKYIELEILDNKMKSYFNKRISVSKTTKIMKEAEKVNNATERIKEYDIDEDLLDTLIEYFVIMPDDLEELQASKESYKLMRKNMEDLKLKNFTPNVDAGIQNILSEKEELLQKIKEKPKQRTR